MSILPFLYRLRTIVKDERDISGLRRLILGLALGGYFDSEIGDGKLSEAGMEIDDITYQVADALQAPLIRTKFERLSSVAILKKGLTPIKQVVSGKYPLVVTADERIPCDHFDFEGKAAIIPMVSSSGHGNASLKRVHYQEGKFAVGTILCAAFPRDPNTISARFLYEYLTAFKDELLVSQMVGTANVSLTLAKIGEVPVPVISRLAISRLDVAMTLCDQLELAQKEQEIQRDALRAVLLERLTAPDQELEAKREVRFFLDTTPRLITKPEHVESIRQSIFDLAVQGRLVPQNSEDETASQLLARTLATRSITDAVPKRNGAHLPPLSEHLPEVAPPGWGWTRLQDVATMITKGTTPTSVGHAFTKEGVNFVKVESIRNGQLLPGNISSFISAETNEFLGRSRLESGDVLFSIAGTIGTCAVVRDNVLPANTNQALAIIRGTDVVFVSAFLLTCIRSSVAQLVVGKARGGAMNNISLGDIRNFVVPVPPLPEQKRIVAKVDELMALCDELETALETAQVQRRRLLESLLHEVLSGGNGAGAPSLMDAI